VGSEVESMGKLEVGKEFYVIKIRKEKETKTWLFDNEREALDTFKELVTKTRSLKPDDILFFKVNTGDWYKNQVDWSEILFKILREGQR